MSPKKTFTVCAVLLAFSLADRSRTAGWREPGDSFGYAVELVDLATGASTVKPMISNWVPIIFIPELNRLAAVHGKKLTTFDLP